MKILTRMCTNLDGYVTNPDGWPVQLAFEGWDAGARWASSGSKLDATPSSWAASRSSRPWPPRSGRGVTSPFTSSPRIARPEPPTP